MKKKHIDKSYIYERDDRKCTFCRKDLKFRQMSVDHYFPKSRGGSNDIFNLVLSCKKCNRLKSSRIPNAYKKKITKLFIRAVEDGKVVASSNLKTRNVKSIISDIKRLEFMGEYYAFQSETHRVYVKDNKIYKIIELGGTEKESEGDE